MWGATAIIPLSEGKACYFNPRSPCGERLELLSPLLTEREFQSTLPVWGATASQIGFSLVSWISIHAPRVGSDSPASPTKTCPWDFNPRSPCGERPGLVWRLDQRPGISIHAPRVGSDRETRLPVIVVVISIHAPRVGSDRPCIGIPCGREISIHAPRVGSDPIAQYLLADVPLFQSTLPVWGATGSVRHARARVRISIHAPRVGSDYQHFVQLHRQWDISIHAPRVGSDKDIAKKLITHRNFNPRSPCGERPLNVVLCELSRLFQSTLPVWGATTTSKSSQVKKRAFQSTLPVWGATPVCQRGGCD